jgi:hypothetical protein
VDLSTAIAKLMRHRQWGEASLRFVAGNAELIEGNAGDDGNRRTPFSQSDHGR